MACLGDGFYTRSLAVTVITSCLDIITDILSEQAPHPCRSCIANPTSHRYPSTSPMESQDQTPSKVDSGPDTMLKCFHDHHMQHPDGRSHCSWHRQSLGVIWDYRGSDLAGLLGGGRILHCSDSVFAFLLPVIVPRSHYEKQRPKGLALV